MISPRLAFVFPFLVSGGSFFFFLTLGAISGEKWHQGGPTVSRRDTGLLRTSFHRARSPHLKKHLDEQGITVKHLIFVTLLHELSPSTSKNVRTLHLFIAKIQNFPWSTKVPRENVIFFFGVMIWVWFCERGSHNLSIMTLSSPLNWSTFFLSSHHL